MPVPMSFNGYLLIRIAMLTLGQDFVLSHVGPYSITVIDALTLLSPEEFEAAAYGLNVPHFIHGWLSLKVIDAFLWIIQAMHENVAVVPTSLVFPAELNERIQHCTQLLIPLPVNDQHCTLLVFDKNQRTVRFVDPERKLTRNSFPNLDEYITSLCWRVDEKTGWDSTSWNYIEDRPLQKDNYNSGTIICLVALGLVEGWTIAEMNSVLYSKMRKQIAVDLNVHSCLMM